MTQAINKPLVEEKTLLDQFRNLTIEQQQTILDFMEFMTNKNPKLQEVQLSENPKVSAYDLAKQLAGCVESGIGDLSTNKKYLQGFGK